MSTRPVITSTIASPLPEVVVVKPFNRRPYIIIAVIFIIIIIIWLVIFLVMYFSNSGSFGTYTRPPPSDSKLIPVNGTLQTLTPAEKAALKTKVEQALANLGTQTT